MANKKKILIFIDLPIILRHFIANKTFKNLEENYDLIYVFNQDKYNFKANKIVKDNILPDQIRTTFIPRKRTGKWFLLYIITVLRQQKTKGEKNYKSRLILERKRIGKRNLFLAQIAGLPLIYQITRFVFIKLLGIHPEIKNLIKDEKPDLILHPSILQGYYVNELFRVYIKNRKSIPLILLMNSWDNPSQKAFCTGSPTKLVVWGEQSKQHAIKYMKMNKKDIECFGAAQFEVYKNKPKYSRNELAKFFKVNPKKKIILYAGSGHGGYETEYLRLLDEFINSNLLDNCHIIYRPHPWRGGLGEGEEDFLSIKWENITIDPSMHEYYQNEIKNVTGLPSLVDYEITNMLLTLVDAVISPLSTILVEALVNGKPILLFFPDKQNNDNEVKPKDLIHFAELIKLKNINVCYEQKYFRQSCLDLYKQIDDLKLSKVLIKDSEFFVTRSKYSYSKQLFKLVKNYL